MHSLLRRIPAVAVLAAAALAAPATAAQSAAGPYERGPDPTESSVVADRGPFAVATKNVPAFSHPGLRTGHIYYPTDTSQGTFGAIAISPGFASAEATVAWYGPRLASQGFVVMTIETSTGFDLPASRASQLLAALDYMKRDTTVRTRIDPNRMAVMGWSMGGGGTLRAAQQTPGLKAIVPLAPWDLGANFRNVRVPTLVIGADNDTVAGTGAHSEPYYGQISAEKAYLELNNADHFTFISSNDTIAKYSLSWLKRWVDEDTRYDRFLCPAPGASRTIEEYRSTCPY